MILTQAQAEAVYSAMCALNKVGGRVSVTLPGRPDTIARGETVNAYEDSTGRVFVVLVGVDGELYPNQSAFATAYGLNSDEWQSDVAAAAGGLTQTAIAR